ncbi:MAG: hypothetical protein NTV43_02925 [Methylococcales bacterium]|nr:hypothetical protein [Methylococcales bacterium]
MVYTIKEHRLNFAVWAAYRAAQAGSSKAKGYEFSDALKNCGVIDFIDTFSGNQITHDEFDQLHSEWCNSIINVLKNNHKKLISYGIAAKLLNCFFKTYYILAGNEEEILAKVVHMPIDSVLLKRIDEKKKTVFDKEYKWQKLDETRYFELIAKLKAISNSDEPLWKMERYWVIK